MKKPLYLLFSVVLFNAFSLSSCKEEEEGIIAEFQSGQFLQNTCAGADGLSSPNGTQATNIHFKNETTKSLKIYWVNFTGDLTLYHADVAPGTGKTQPTFLQHPWYITTADEECVTVLTALRPVVTDTVVFRH